MASEKLYRNNLKDTAKPEINDAFMHLSLNSKPRSQGMSFDASKLFYSGIYNQPKTSGGKRQKTGENTKNNGE